MNQPEFGKRLSYERLEPIVERYAREAYPELDIAVYPTMGMKVKERTYGQYNPRTVSAPPSIQILLKGSTGYLEEVLAVLAHEFGHHEQQLAIESHKVIPPPTEADAYLRGVKWAQKWGILPAYARDLINRVNWYPQQFPQEVDRVIRHIKSLIGG